MSGFFPERGFGYAQGLSLKAGRDLAGQRWFFIIDIHRADRVRHFPHSAGALGGHSLFGAFVPASLPAVGGGLIRDLLIVHRDTPGGLVTRRAVFYLKVKSPMY